MLTTQAAGMAREPGIEVLEEPGQVDTGGSDMKVNSISGVLCQATDIDSTAKFYGNLGFRLGKREPNRLTCYVNWFWVTFVLPAQEGYPEVLKAGAAEREGPLVYVKVDDLDAFYEDVLSHGMMPAGEPHEGPTGNREFILRDPDGQRLAFFEKK
jgi:catechol 2,3-dioxygenase-like lactoylglutathione lyase family enzyme